MSYSPILGRFLERDPIGHEDGMHLYQYERSNPVNRLDTQGTDSVVSQTGQIGVVVGPLDAIDAVGHPLPGTTAHEAFDFGRRMEAKYNKDRCYKPGEIENALRHVYWQALLTMDHGAENAEQIGNIHEHDALDPIDSAADQGNNDVGRRIGQRASNREDARYMAEAAFLRGQLHGWGSLGRERLDPAKCMRKCPTHTTRQAGDSDNYNRGSGSYDPSSS